MEVDEKAVFHIWPPASRSLHHKFTVLHRGIIHDDKIKLQNGGGGGGRKGCQKQEIDTASLAN